MISCIFINLTCDVLHLGKEHFNMDTLYIVLFPQSLVGALIRKTEEKVM